MSTLHIHRLSHRYGLKDVLADVELRLSAGETLALVGPSGCGKSTLLHIVAGLLQPSEARITSTFQRVSCVFQEPRLMPWKTALDNIALGLKALRVPKAARRQQAADLATRMGLGPDDLNKFPHELSGGMQSRVSLARALITQPDLLLLDEAFAALDIGLKSELYSLLRGHVCQYQTAVLMITHDLMEAVRLADRMVVMAADPGRLVCELNLGTPHAHRGDTWVYQTTARLIQHDDVRTSFALVDAALSDAKPTESVATQQTGCAV